MSLYKTLLDKLLFSDSADAAKKARLVLLATKTYTTVKEIVRTDGAERVRIFRGGNDAFGAVIEERGEEDEEWSPYHFIGAGCVYDSAEVVELEAKHAVAWLRSQSAGPDAGH